MVSGEFSARFYSATMPANPEEVTDRCPCLSQETAHNDRRSHPVPRVRDILGAVTSGRHHDVTSGRHHDPIQQKKTFDKPCCYPKKDRPIQERASGSVHSDNSSPSLCSSPLHMRVTDFFSSHVHTPPAGCLLTPRNVPVDIPPRFYSPDAVRPPLSPQPPLKQMLSCDENLEHLRTPSVDIAHLAALQRDQPTPSPVQRDIFEHTQHLCFLNSEGQCDVASDETWMDCCEVAEEQAALRVSIATPRHECASARWHCESSGSPGPSGCSPCRMRSYRSLPSRLAGMTDRLHGSEGKRLLIRSLAAQDHGFENLGNQSPTDPTLSPSVCTTEQPTSRIRCQQAWPPETCCFLCNSPRALSKPVPSSYKPESVTCGENDGLSLVPTTSTGTDDSNPFIYRTLPSPSLPSAGPRRRRRKASLLVCPLPPPPASFMSRESHLRHRPSWFIHTHPQFRQPHVQTLCLFLLRVRMRLKLSIQAFNRLLQLHPGCFFSGYAPVSLSTLANTSWKQIASRGGNVGVNLRGIVFRSRSGSLNGIASRRGSRSGISTLSKQEKAARSTVRAIKSAEKRWIAQNRASCGGPGDSADVIRQGTRNNGNEVMKSMHTWSPTNATEAVRGDSLHPASVHEVGQLFLEPVSKQPDLFQRMDSHAEPEKTTHSRECRSTYNAHQGFSLRPITMLPVTFVGQGFRSIQYLVSFLFAYSAEPRWWQSKMLKKISSKLHKHLKFLILLVTMYPFVHGLYLPGLALIWAITRIRVACWWLYVNRSLGYRTSEELHREWISNWRRCVRLNDQSEGNKQASMFESSEFRQPIDYIKAWLRRTYVGCAFQWLFSTYPTRTVVTWGCSLWNLTLPCITAFFIGTIDISFLSVSPGVRVLQWVMSWEAVSERIIERVVRALGEIVTVITELVLSIAAAVTALGATDSHIVAAVDAMTEKEAVYAAGSQGSVYLIARRVGGVASAEPGSQRREDVVKRLWRVGEGWWLSWPWKHTLVGSVGKRDNCETRGTSEKSLATNKAGSTPMSRPPRRTEIFEVLSGQELMMFSQPLMIVSGVGFSDHLTIEDLIEVVETRLLAKKEQTSAEDDVTVSEDENQREPLTVFKHPRLRTVIGKLFGRYCWVRAEEFCVRNHVLKLNRHEALSLLRYHNGGLHSLHQGVLRPSEPEKQRSTDEESRTSTFSSGGGDGRFKDEITCDGGNNCKCVITSAEAQALENILATQALQPSMPLWQFVLLEHVELPVFDEDDDSEEDQSGLHKYDGDGFEELSCASRQVGSMVMFRIHHAVADGIAITNMFLSDVLSAPCLRDSSQKSSPLGAQSKAGYGICEPGPELTSFAPSRIDERNQAFPLQRLKGVDEPDMSNPLSSVRATTSDTSGVSSKAKESRKSVAPEDDCLVSCTADTASPKGADQGLPTSSHEDRRDIRFRLSPQSRGGDKHSKYPDFHEDRAELHLPKGGSCGNTGATSVWKPNSYERTEDGPAGTAIRSQKSPSDPGRRRIKSLVPPLTPPSIFLRTLMQLISYLYVPYTVASLLMLTEEKSWDCPEKPRPPRSGSVWVLQPIRFRLQELKRLRRALAALSPATENSGLHDATERLQRNADASFCKLRLRRLSEHIRKRPLLNFLMSLAHFISPISNGSSAFITCLGRSAVKQAQLGEAQCTPAEADSADSSTSMQLIKKTVSTSQAETASKKALRRQDLFTINEVLATCLVGGICRYVHKKVAAKYSLRERLDTFSGMIPNSRSEALQYPECSSRGQEFQINAAQQRTSVTPHQTAGSLKGTGQSVTNIRSDISKAAVLTYNKSVNGISSYCSSTCSTTTSIKSSSVCRCHDCVSVHGLRNRTERSLYGRTPCSGLRHDLDSVTSSNREIAADHMLTRGLEAASPSAGSVLSRMNVYNACGMQSADHTPSALWVRNSSIGRTERKTYVDVPHNRRLQAVSTSKEGCSSVELPPCEIRKQYDVTHSSLFQRHQKGEQDDLMDQTICGGNPPSLEQAMLSTGAGNVRLAEGHITAGQERRKEILQMELDMLEQLIPQLNIVVPVNLRTTEEESFELRNNFTSAVVQVAAAHAFKARSAYERLLGVRKSLQKSVKSLGAQVFAFMEKVSFCTTPDFLLFLQIWLTKKMSVLFSNVPGPSELPQIQGRQVHAMHFIGPLAGRIGLIVSAFSYADNLDLVITTDTAMLESPELLRQCILEEYRELKQLCPLSQLT